MEYNQITIKKDIVMSLIGYQPKFEKFSRQEHKLNKQNCQDMIKTILLPISKEIKDDIIEAKDKNQCNVELLKANQDCKFLLGLFRTCQRADMPILLSCVDRID